MLVNDIDMEQYGITLLSRDIENSELITYDDWLDDGFSPLTHRQVFKFSYVECEFLVEQSNDDLAEEVISDFLYMSKQATLEFEDLSRTYMGVMDDVEKDWIVPGVFELKVKWKCEYSFKDEPEFVLTGTMGTIYVPGNTETPAIVEITPLINLIDLNIFGLGEDITIKNLTTNKTITIDGEEGKITEEGQNKYKDYDSWGFPYLVPGKNKITIDRDNVEIKIKYKSRWI